MNLLLSFSLLGLQPAPAQAPPTAPLSLGDTRFQYTVSKQSGSASAPTRTLWVQPIRTRRGAQVIPLTGPAAEEPSTNVVLRDVNFDGQPDLMVTVARGTVNSQYAYWLYNADRQQFVLNRPMSTQLGGYKLTFDAKAQQIVAQSRYSCCEHQTRTYAWRQGMLRLLKTETATTPPAAKKQHTTSTTSVYSP